jgi:hypothetical protein
MTNIYFDYDKYQTENGICDLVMYNILGITKNVFLKRKQKKIISWVGKKRLAEKLGTVNKKAVNKWTLN